MLSLLSYSPLSIYRSGLTNQARRAEISFPFVVTATPDTTLPGSRQSLQHPPIFNAPWRINEFKQTPARFHYPELLLNAFEMRGHDKLFLKNPPTHPLLTNVASKSQALYAVPNNLPSVSPSYQSKLRISRMDKPRTKGQYRFAQGDRHETSRIYKSASWTFSANRLKPTTLK
jgi:hypothetical protein